MLGTGEFFRGREHGACPHCHSEDLVEAGKCELCGAELNPYEEFCGECMDELMNAWNSAVLIVAKRHNLVFEKAERLLLDFMEIEVF